MGDFPRAVSNPILNQHDTSETSALPVVSVAFGLAANKDTCTQLSKAVCGEALFGNQALRLPADVENFDLILRNQCRKST